MEPLLQDGVQVRIARRPGQVAPGAEYVAVDDVADAPDRLADDCKDDRCVPHQPHRQSVAPGEDRHAGESGDDRAEEGHSPLPDSDYPDGSQEAYQGMV